MRIQFDKKVRIVPFDFCKFDPHHGLLFLSLVKKQQLITICSHCNHVSLFIREICPHIIIFLVGVAEWTTTGIENKTTMTYLIP